jgi:CxxC motif-containing protein (DUF1111 family)
LFGLGYVEAVSDTLLAAIASRQERESRGRIRGEPIQVALLEKPGQKRTGRFGWKNQHASLVSFAADAYLNEMGVTNPFLPQESTFLGANTFLGEPIDDGQADPEDDGEGVANFATFMRALKAPPRDAALAASLKARAGAALFVQIGCAMCHVPTLFTLPPGSPINGGTFRVPPALGNKIIHPYSDFLLHDVGTGDGIVQNGGPSTRNKIRTAPLWGLRLRTRFMHDGASLTRSDAIQRHGGEAAGVLEQYRRLSNTAKGQLDRFLGSL